jgi:hypothetical protein
VEDGAYIDGQFKRNTANAGGKIANEDQSKITKVKVS